MSAPDGILLAQAYCAGHPTLQAIFGQRITTNLPAKPVLPCATFDLVDSSPRDSRSHWTWEYLIDIDVYGADEKAARDAAFALSTALLDAPGYLHHLGTIVHVEGSGPAHAPDEQTTPARERFTFSINLHAHP